MPEIPEPRDRWICCCEHEPPSLRCDACGRSNHRSCADPMCIPGAPRR